MKRIVVFSIAVIICSCTSVRAISVNVERFGGSPENGLDIYGVYLDAEEATLDAIGVEILPNPGAELKNPTLGFDFFITPGAGSVWSIPNLLLGVSISQGGEGFSLLNVESKSHRIAFEGGPLGGTIQTPPAPGLFLANVAMPPNGTASYSVKIVSVGETLDILRGPIGIPEPTTMALAGLSLIGLVASRRRS